MTNINLALEIVLNKYVSQYNSQNFDTLRLKNQIKNNIHLGQFIDMCVQ